MIQTSLTANPNDSCDGCGKATSRRTLRLGKMICDACWASEPVLFIPAKGNALILALANAISALNRASEVLIHNECYNTAEQCDKARKALESAVKEELVNSSQLQ